MAGPTPCQRCGGFVSTGTLDAGYTVCEECIERVIEGPPKARSTANVAAGVGALAGVAVTLVLGLAVSPIFFAYIHVFAGGGAFVGIFGGMPFDVVRARRERAARGFEGVAWIAVLERKTSGAPTRAGFAFAGSGRLLFASKAGDRVVLHPRDVTTIRSLEDARVELDVVEAGAPARLVLVGKGARAAAERMMEG